MSPDDALDECDEILGLIEVIRGQSNAGNAAAFLEDVEAKVLDMRDGFESWEYRTITVNQESALRNWKDAINNWRL